MAIKKKLLLVLLLIFFLQKGTFAQLSIIPDISDAYVDKLVNIARANYPRFKALQSQVNIAKNNITKTHLSLFDAITVSYVYQPGTATIDPTNPSTSYFKGLQAGVFVNLGTLIARPFQTKQAKLELTVATSQQDEYLLTFTTEVKKRYYTYIVRLNELKLQTKSTQDVQSSLKDIRAKFERGEETYDNYNKAQMQYTDHQGTQIQAEANLFIAKAELEEMIGTKLENVK